MEKKRTIVSMLALTTGVIFVVLAGAMFATTTWKVMPSIAKVGTVFLAAALFFGASEGAERIFRIHWTAAACYLLGSIFLFLTVAAAGYFRLLGPLFMGVDGGWRICSLGGILMTAAMVFGMRKYGSSFYTQLCLCSVTVNVGLLMQVFGCSDTAFTNGMAIYSCILMVSGLVMKQRVGVAVWIHFILFGTSAMLACGTEYLWMLLSFGKPEEGFLHIAGNLLTLFLVAGTSVLYGWKEKKLLGIVCFQTVVAEMIHYGVMAAAWQLDGHLNRHMDRVYLIMAALTALVFLAGRKLLPRLGCEAGDSGSKFARSAENSGSKFVRGAGDGALKFRCNVGDAILGFVQLKDTIFLAMFAIFDGELLFSQFEIIVALFLMILVLREWGKRYVAVRGAIPLVFWYMMVPVSLILKHHVWMGSFPHMEEWLVLGCTAVMMAWDAWKKDVFGPAIAGIVLIMMSEAKVIGYQEMETMWYLLAGIYVLRFAGTGRCRKVVFTASVCLFTGAYLRQPWMVWPEIVETEMRLLPVAGILYVMGQIWKGHKGVEVVQTAGWLGCLLVLSVDAVCMEKVADALILEGICLAVFVMAHLAESRKWVRISGGFLIVIAVYMTKGFWLSIAWWVYLMAAGIGLILFAAVRERKKNQE